MCKYHDIAVKFLTDAKRIHKTNSWKVTEEHLLEYLAMHNKYGKLDKEKWSRCLIEVLQVNGYTITPTKDNPMILKIEGVLMKNTLLETMNIKETHERIKFLQSLWSDKFMIKYNVEKELENIEKELKELLKLVK